MTDKAYKEWGVVVVALLVSCLEFFGVAALAQPLPPAGGTSVVLLIISIIWLLVMSLAFVLVTHPASKFALIVGPTALVVLAGRLGIGAWGGALLLILSLVTAQQYLMQEIRNRIQYSTVQVFRFGARYLVIGLMLAIAGIILPGVQNSVSADGVRLTDNQVNAILKFADPVIKGFIPSFSSQDNVDQFIDAQIAEQLGKLPPGVTVPVEQRVALRAELARQLNQKLTGQESMAHVLTQRFNDIVGAFTRSNALIVALVVIILVFFTMRALVPLIVWPLIALIALTVWISNASGLSKLTNSTATVTKLEL